MKTRTFIALLFLLFLAITIGLSVYVGITSTENTAPAVGSTPVTTTTPSTTPTSIATATTAPTLKDRITTIEGTIFDPIIAALEYVAVVLIAVLIIVAVKLVWDYSGKTNLVIDAFTNATGDTALDKVLPGLIQLTRKKLAEAFDIVRDDINKYIDPGLEHLSDTPPPESTSNEQLSNVLKSLTDVSSGNTKTAVQLLSLVFGPSGTRVSTTLHCLGDASGHGRLGIGLEIIDLQGREEPMLWSCWEKEKDISANERQLSGVSHIFEGILKQLPWRPQGNKQTEPQQTLEERFLELVLPAARWLSIELTFRSMERSGHSARHYWMLAWKNMSFQTIWTRFKKSGEWKSTYQARLYNFIGYYHLNNAQDFSAYGYSYDLAIQAFSRAKLFDKYWILPKIWFVPRPWFLPDENLGLTYLTRALQPEKIKQSNPLRLTDEGIDDIYQALSSFSKAKELFESHKNGQPVSDEKLDEMHQFLTLLICITQLLTENDGLINKSIDEVLALTGGWNLDKKINFRILYNLACWYGVVYSIGFNARDRRLVNARRNARHIIVRCLARNAEFWYSAAHDPNLKDIAVPEDWNKLKSILERVNYSNAGLSNKENGEFASVINDILLQLGWR